MPTQKDNEKLTAIIREKIKQTDGCISFAEYQALALYHPEFGYYNAADMTFGKKGDFTTAPEISALFAHCFAQQCQQILAQQPGDILELGAGSGRFAKDLLLKLEELEQLPEHYFIYEISSSLRKQQQQLLKKDCAHLLERIHWLETLPENFTGIIIANEVLDALPVHGFRIEKNEVKERCVANENEQLVWKLQDPTQALRKAVSDLRDQYHLADGYESEINLALSPFIQTLAKMLQKGVMFFVDYGYGQREYYRPERSKGTLTCFYKHEHDDDPLSLVGRKDITAHVDFTRVIESASAAGCELLGYTTQAAFLLSCGIMALAESEATHLSTVEAFTQAQAIKLLTMPTEMGELIKVMAISKKVDFPLLGFTFQDRRRDL